MSSEALRPILIFFIIGLLFWAYHRWSVYVRQTWEAFAKREQLNYLGSELPPTLSAAALGELPLFVRAQCCVSGKLHGEEVFAFQISRRGYTRNSHWVTVLGLKQKFPERYQGKTSFNLKLARTEQWVVLSSRAWFPVTLNGAEVLKAWAELRTTVTDEESVHAPEMRSIFIRPRHERPTDL